MAINLRRWESELSLREGKVIDWLTFIYINYWFVRAVMCLGVCQKGSQREVASRRTKILKWKDFDRENPLRMLNRNYLKNCSFIASALSLNCIFSARFLSHPCERKNNFETRKNLSSSERGQSESYRDGTETAASFDEEEMTGRIFLWKSSQV